MSSGPSGTNARDDARLAGLLLAVFLAMTIAASRYAPVPREFPLLVGGVGTLLSAIGLVRFLLRARSSPPLVSGGSARQRVFMFLWFATAIGSVLGAGVVAGGAVFVFAFLRGRARESWRFAASAAVAFGLGLHLGLERGFGLELFGGVFSR